MPEFTATTKDQVQQLLNQHGKVAVIDLYADWCGPCKIIAPVAKTLSDENNVVLIKINVDQAEELSAEYKVQAMPTFVIVKDSWNNVVDRLVGANKAAVGKFFQTAAHKK